MVRIRNVIFTAGFEKAMRKLKDAGLKERVKRQIEEITEKLEMGKPLRFQKKGERTIRVPPFRIIYACNGDTLYLLDFDKRDRVYR
ncbi:MAG: type II toxin-antitoxin system RelE/ParE family toxin [Candidatus Micrarchaeota archaeon]